MANIRVDALTEVTTIADDDVVMVDGKQGVRATTWAALKNLIKQQCGINELNTNMNTIVSGTSWVKSIEIRCKTGSGALGLLFAQGYMYILCTAGGKISVTKMIVDKGYVEPSVVISGLAATFATNPTNQAYGLINLNAVNGNGFYISQSF